MQRANDWRQLSSTLDFEVLSSMISELVRHHERQLTGNELSLDWESPSRTTRVIKYGTSTCLFNVLNQVPDSIAAEYQLSYQGTPVFSWHEYRWPHLNNVGESLLDQKVLVPQECVDELMRYHIEANTNWLSRYRNRLRCQGITQIDEIGVVA